MASKFDLEDHLQIEHRISPFATYLKEIVYGGNDGIVTTFAVVAGFAGSQSDPLGSLPIISVLLFGFANLFADGASMALGNFLSSRSEQDVYRGQKLKEEVEIRHNKEAEIEESIAILTQKGFTKSQAQDLTKIYQTNPRYWVEFMMHHELELPNPEGENPKVMALATFISFVIFGLIPLLPYVFWRELPNVFVISCLFTFGAMLALGLLRAIVSKQPLLKPVLENVILGTTAAVVAYFVGSLFRI